MSRAQIAFPFWIAKNETKKLAAGKTHDPLPPCCLLAINSSQLGLGFKQYRQLHGTFGERSLMLFFLGGRGKKIGRYEGDEMKLSIEVAKNLARILETTVGYLLGETDDSDLFSDPKMLQRFEDIVNLPDNQKECILTTMDHFIRSAKIATL